MTDTGKKAEWPIKSIAFSVVLVLAALSPAGEFVHQFVSSTGGSPMGAFAVAFVLLIGNAVTVYAAYQSMSAIFDRLPKPEEGNLQVLAAYLLVLTAFCGGLVWGLQAIRETIVPDPLASLAEIAVGMMAIAVTLAGIMAFTLLSTSFTLRVIERVRASRVVDNTANDLD
ncbi:hypothetical protein [Ruegeria atlantica]|uniref:hypothetical protein n=1 Tax=Ruegeria atlantica TaxID=81569 RepID=UPI0024944690|nr:hypothetical protein [Ruegeria atlantica]